MFAGGLALLGSTADAFVAAPAQAPIRSPKSMKRSDVSQAVMEPRDKGQLAEACRGALGRVLLLELFRAPM